MEQAHDVLDHEKGASMQGNMGRVSEMEQAQDVLDHKKGASTQWKEYPR